MAGDIYQKTNSGQRFTGTPSRLDNILRDVARAQQADGYQSTTPGGKPPQGMIYVRNNSGSAVQRFGVLGISGVLIDDSKNLVEFQNKWALTGVTPTSSHLGKFCITWEPIAAGAIGRAFIADSCPAQVKIANPADPCADVLVGDATQLQSGLVGAAQILFAGSPISEGSSTCWCIIRLGNPRQAVRVKIVARNTTYNSELSGSGYYEGASVTGTVTGPPPGDLPDAGETVSSTNDVLVENIWELIRWQSWCVEINTFHVGSVVGQSTETPPRPIVRIGVPNTPVPLYLTGENTVAPGVYGAAVFDVTSGLLGDAPVLGGISPQRITPFTLDSTTSGNGNWGGVIAINAAEFGPSTDWALITSADPFNSGTPITAAMPAVVMGQYLQHNSDGTPVFWFEASPVSTKIPYYADGATATAAGANIYTDGTHLYFWTGAVWVMLA